MSGMIFSICTISAFSTQQAAPKRCRKESNKEQEKREMWAKSKPTLNLVPRSMASSTTAPSSSASSRPEILRAPSQQGSTLIAQCAKKPAAGGLNQSDAASSSQVWLTDAKVERMCQETRSCRARVRVFQKVLGNLPLKIWTSTTRTT